MLSTAIGDRGGKVGGFRPYLLSKRMIHPFSRYTLLDRAIATMTYVQVDERESSKCFESCAIHDPMVVVAKNHSFTQKI